MKRDHDILRIGSPPSAVYYSLPKQGHSNNYMGKVLTISGKGIRHIKQECSKEAKEYTYIKRKEQPNSKRVFTPEKFMCENEKQERKRFFYPLYFSNKSALGNNMVNQQKEYEDLHPKRFKKDKNTSKNIEIHMGNSLNSSHHINSSHFPVSLNSSHVPLTPQNSNISNSLKHHNTPSFISKVKRDLQSGIATLPGGAKKRWSEISDDLTKNERIEKVKNDAFALGYKREGKTQYQTYVYTIKNKAKNFSQISCLPGGGQVETRVVNNLTMSLYERPSRRRKVKENKLENLLYKSNNLFYPKEDNKEETIKTIGRNRIVFDVRRRGNENLKSKKSKNTFNIDNKILSNYKTYADKIIQEKEGINKRHIF